MTSANYTITVAEGSLTITTRATGNNSGNVGSGGTSSPTVTNKPDSHVGEDAITAKIEVSSSNGSATVSASEMTATTEEAIKAAETANLTATVEIHVNTPSDVAELRVTIPSASVKAFADSAADTLSIVSAVGEMAMDGDTANSIAEQADGGADITFSFTRLSKESLNERQRLAVGDSPVYDISITSGDRYIVTFDGVITVSLPYTLNADQNPEGVAVWYLDADGNIEQVWAAYDPLSQMVTFAVDHLSLYFIAYSEPVAWANPFTDVDEDDWFYDDVAYARQNDLFNGTSATTFSPQTSMTRGMVVTVLGRLAGIDVADYSGASFDDVNADTYYAPYIKWAAELGIVSGVGDNNYEPDTSISRQDLAVILNNYADKTGVVMRQTMQIVVFADSEDIADYATAAVANMARAGIVNGKPDSIFDPVGNATRAEVAVVLRRFAEAVK